MIKYKDIWHNRQSGELIFSVIDFQCDNCQNQFTDDSINLSVFLYGFFSLQNKETSYIGITCPSCISTILIKENSSPSSLLTRLSSLNSFGNFEIQPQLVYFSSIYHFDNICNRLPELECFNIDYINTAVSEESRYNINNLMASHVSENGLGNHLCSLVESDGPFPQPELFVLYVDEQHLGDIVKYEQENDVRIIPRYMHKLELFNQIEMFCAQYDFNSRLASLETLANESLDKLKQVANENNLDVDQMIADDPSILHTGQLDIFRQNEISNDGNDFSIASDFMSILAADPYPWDVPGKNRDWIKEFWRRQQPFRNQKIPTFLMDLSKRNPNNKPSEKHERIFSEVRPVFSKGYIQKFLSDLYENFIFEYSQIAIKYEFSFADVWDLKERYLEKVHKCVMKKKATRPSYNHKEACRLIAKGIWLKQPDITIVDMCLSDEIATACEGTVYPEATLRKWIKDLCPNRRPGRRPKTKKK